jgi:hypothetical protein
MGIFANLFGGKKAKDDLLDKDNGLLTQAGNWVDKLNYTKEEQAQGNLAVMKLGIDRLKALEPFKVAQRILAFAVAGMWSFLGINIIGAVWVKVLTTGRTDATGAIIPAIDAVKPLLDFAFSNFMLIPVGLVFTLYMGGGTIESFKRTKT